jgi:hypothetical protein
MMTHVFSHSNLQMAAAAVSQSELPVTCREERTNQTLYRGSLISEQGTLTTLDISLLSSTGATKGTATTSTELQVQRGP